MGGEELLYWFIDALPLIMIGVLAVLLLSGYPVAFVLAGTGVLFAGVGWLLDEFPLIAFFKRRARRMRR